MSVTEYVLDLRTRVRWIWALSIRIVCLQVWCKPSGTKQFKQCTLSSINSNHRTLAFCERCTLRELWSFKLNPQYSLVFTVPNYFNLHTQIYRTHCTLINIIVLSERAYSTVPRVSKSYCTIARIKNISVEAAKASWPTCCPRHGSSLLFFFFSFFHRTTRIDNPLLIVYISSQ